MSASPLTPELDRWIDERVRAGAFKDRDEALRQAVRLLKRDEEQHAAQIVRLNAAIDEGQADLDAGDFDDVAFDRLDAYLATLGRAAP